LWEERKNKKLLSPHPPPGISVFIFVFIFSSIPSLLLLRVVGGLSWIFFSRFSKQEDDATFYWMDLAMTGR
jgi:hypothetical protein